MKPINAFELAAQACRYAETSRELKLTKHRLDEAYRSWKRANGIDFYIERDSCEWVAMLAGTDEEYAALVKAKRRERYHRERLVILVGRVQP